MNSKKLLILKDETLSDCNLKKVEIPHFNRGFATNIYVSENNVYEVNVYSNPCSSAFIGNYLNSDGSIQYLSKIDPIFFIIQIFCQNEVNLIKDSDSFSEFYRTINDIVDSSNYTNDLKNCLKYVCIDSMNKLCQVKDQGNVNYFKYITEKTLDFLIKKIEKIQNYFIVKGHNIDASKLYAFEIVTEYVPQKVENNIDTTPKVSLIEEMRIPMSNTTPKSKTKKRKSVLVAKDTPSIKLFYGKKLKQ
ncbi:hypothetical protein A3Q56_02327 [Intoshia linei]|uniref:Ribonuclease H2 subunit B wHTH domain-containing protein n=1 Tax=Intoshia linei TaxID=1819745 RepID=A0A177B6K9_9BILA|nr:hypothetical protein A3Q56_02327 [Intoshia linei]